MQTMLLYLLIMAVVVAVVFAVVWFVFGRGEDLPPLERGTTPTRLPRAGITGSDVRAVTFTQTLRGYSTAEVDWVVEKLARELDELRGVVRDLQDREMDDRELEERAHLDPAGPAEVDRDGEATDLSTTRGTTGGESPGGS